MFERRQVTPLRPSPGNFEAPEPRHPPKNMIRPQIFVPGDDESYPPNGGVRTHPDLPTRSARKVTNGLCNPLTSNEWAPQPSQSSLSREGDMRQVAPPFYEGAAVETDRRRRENFTALEARYQWEQIRDRARSEGSSPGGKRPK